MLVYFSLKTSISKRHQRTFLKVYIQMLAYKMYPSIDCFKFLNQHISNILVYFFSNKHTYASTEKAHSCISFQEQIQMLAHKTHTSIVFSSYLNLYVKNMLVFKSTYKCQHIKITECTLFTGSDASIKMDTSIVLLQVLIKIYTQMLTYCRKKQQCTFYVFELAYQEYAIVFFFMCIQKSQHICCASTQVLKLEEEEEESPSVQILIYIKYTRISLKMLAGKIECVNVLAQLCVMCQLTQMCKCVSFPFSKYANILFQVSGGNAEGKIDSVFLIWRFLQDKSGAK